MTESYKDFKERKRIQAERTRGAKVQIDRALFEVVCLAVEAYHEESGGYDADFLLRAAWPHLQQKMDAIARRDAFTDYKLAERGTADREERRQRYLDAAGLLGDWRSPAEDEG